MSHEEFENQIINTLSEKKLTLEELRKGLNFKGEENQKIFEEVLKNLELEGKIILNNK